MRRASVARMVAITSSGRWVRSSQVNRSTVQPAATARFCRVRSRWNRSPAECQARPSTSIASRTAGNAKSSTPTPASG